MLPETEQLLQKWLKIQIWQFRLMVFKWLFVGVLFILGIVGFFGFALPALRVQFQKLDKIQNQLLNLSDTAERQGELLDQFKNIEQGSGLFDIFTKE